MATAALFAFLAINNLWLTGSGESNKDYLVDLAKRVAKSAGARDKDTLLDEIKSWIAGRIGPVKDNSEE